MAPAAGSLRAAWRSFHRSRAQLANGSCPAQPPGRYRFRSGVGDVARARTGTAGVTSQVAKGRNFGLITYVKGSLTFFTLFLSMLYCPMKAVAANLPIPNRRTQTAHPQT